MPLYSYKCQLCSKVTTAFRKIAERDRNPACRACDVSGRMERMIEAPMVAPDYAPYNCPITGVLICGKRAHEENLKKHDCRLLEPGENEARDRANRMAEARFESEIESTLEKEIIELPSVKRDRLAAEIEGGLDLEVVRTNVPTN